jgi:hypothetical protein
VRLIAADEIIASAPRPSSDPVRFKARTQHNGTVAEVSIIPDQIFGLDGIGGSTKYFFLEADRATMPVVRNGLDQTSMLRKFLAYAAGGGAANAFGRQLGLPNFRVLTLTTSQERTQSMLAALRAATGGRGPRQFLFADRAALVGARDALTLPWTTGNGEHVCLADER